MAIRILHVVDSLGRGGLENGLVNLIERMDPKRFEHVVYTVRHLGPNADRLPQDRVQVVSLAKKDTDGRFQVPALARAIRQFMPDIVHSRNWGAIEAVIAAKWLRSCAIVHSEHGLENDSRVGEPWRRICFRRLAFEVAHRVLAVSHQLRDLHAKRTGFSRDRITVIHNGVDGGRFFADEDKRARIRQELGLSEKEFCVGCVGNLLPVKDHLNLLKAFSEVAGAGGNWRLLMVGEGPERRRIEGFLKVRPVLQPRVTLLGASNRVPELLRALDLYVLPSIAEGISNSLLEGMASGLPVIVTAVGGNPEVVVDRESGLLFPPGDYLKLAEFLRLLRSHNELRMQLAAQAIGRVRREFSIEAMVRKYEGLYEGVRPAKERLVTAVA